MNEKDVYTFDKNEDAIKRLNELKKSEDCILVKASQSMNFKEIIEKIYS